MNKIIKNNFIKFKKLNTNLKYFIIIFNSDTKFEKKKWKSKSKKNKNIMR